MPLDLVIRGAAVVLSDGVAALDVGVSGGKLVALEAQICDAATETIDGRGLHLFPAAVDVHVHFNEPGRTEWEGAGTGSAAFAAGGGGTYCDMPLNSSPPTLDAESLYLKRAALEAHSCTDFGLWGGLTPQNLDRLDELAECGVVGFKAFMCPSGIDDFLWSNEDVLARGMKAAARHGLLVGVHAEDPKITGDLAAKAIAAGRTGIRDYLASRPIVAETTAIDTAIRLAEQTKCKLHIVHVSSGRGAVLVAEARRRGVDVTCETCPHYLLLTDEDCVRIGAAAKCSPPLRDAAERAELWTALLRGDVSFVASDHSPAPQSMKESTNFFSVWGGISGVQTTLGLLLAEACGKLGLPVHKVGRWTATAPAARFGLAPAKGSIAVGADADLALIDLRRNETVRLDALGYRHKITPFVGRALGGIVRQTIVRGRTVFSNGKAIGSPQGRFVRPQLTSAR